MTETIVVGTVQPELLKQAEDMLALAGSYAITCREMRVAAAEDLKRVKGLQRAIEEQRKEITGPINLGLKRVNDLFRKPAQWLDEAEAALKSICRRWDDEQDRIQRAAEAEAARKADEERRRLADVAKAEAAKGNAETAHAIAQAAQMVAPIPVAVSAPKIEGESTREIWRAEVVDLVALCRAIGEGKAAPEMILPNQTVLNGMARSLKGSLSVAGVRAVSEKILASRAA